MSRAPRMLAEAEVRSLLDAGGMLVASPEAWHAHRRRDARAAPAGRVPLRIAARLQAEDEITGPACPPAGDGGAASQMRAAGRCRPDP